MIKWGGTVYTLHPLFILLLAMAAVTGYILELLTLFVIVIVHEMGHVTVARMFGWTISEVKLLPFGGVAETEDGSLAPAWQEWLVMAAGPLQNGIMIGLALMFEQWGWWGSAWTDDFIRANAFIGLFNLLPVLPLDGGRMLQAAASLWFSYYKTLLIGARVSMAVSAAIAAYSLIPVFTGGKVNLNLLVLGIFLLWSNWEEWKNVPYRFLRFLMSRPARLRKWERSGCLGRPIVAENGWPLSGLLRLLRRDEYHFIYVMDPEGAIKRIIPEQRAIDAYFDEPGGQRK
ncbi:MAG: M50 family metallopeptidase [Paenibacillus dendritiformis]|uniref:M50 family metallopeptidase n=1 Tax=uncultured Paenibacillus sp. TaxID=227322 RepID=UPI0025F13F37|nr:M50 family metallopeptidase [uncultured Paenibacillus sp.]MDU5144819.1 M50 family metallopeptidase [Paenibacillus dendritiformis]